MKGSDTNPVEDLSSNDIKQIPLVKLDPAHPLTITGIGGQKKIEIPEPSYKLETLLDQRRKELFEEENDEEDQTVFEFRHAESGVAQSQSRYEVIEVDDTPPPAPATAKGKWKWKGKDKDGGKGKGKGKGKEQAGVKKEKDWKHDVEWVNRSVAHLMPPPVEASPSATMAVQRELRAMLREQEGADCLRELGWYMPPELVGDNLFQWIVELHSFDPELPIAKDMKAKWVCF